MNLGNLTPPQATLRVPQPRAADAAPGASGRRAADLTDLTEALARFVWDRYLERLGSTDHLDARWASGILRFLDGARAHLIEEPQSWREFHDLLLRLAQAYATHQDFRPDWRPPATDRSYSRVVST